MAHVEPKRGRVLRTVIRLAAGQETSVQSLHHALLLAPQMFVRKRLQHFGIRRKELRRPLLAPGAAGGHRQNSSTWERPNGARYLTQVPTGPIIFRRPHSLVEGTEQLFRFRAGRLPIEIMICLSRTGISSDAWLVARWVASRTVSKEIDA